MRYFINQEKLSTEEENLFKEEQQTIIFAITDYLNENDIEITNNIFQLFNRINNKVFTIWDNNLFNYLETLNISSEKLLELNFDKKIVESYINRKNIINNNRIRSLYLKQKHKNKKK